jgi:hypothetical protein
VAPTILSDQRWPSDFAVRSSSRTRRSPARCKLIVHKAYRPTLVRLCSLPMEFARLDHHAVVPRVRSADIFAGCSKSDCPARRNSESLCISLSRSRFRTDFSFFPTCVANCNLAHNEFTRTRLRTHVICIFLMMLVLRCLFGMSLPCSLPKQWCRREPSGRTIGRRDARCVKVHATCSSSINFRYCRFGSSLTERASRWLLPTDNAIRVKPILDALPAFPNEIVKTDFDGSSMLT